MKNLKKMTLASSEAYFKSRPASVWSLEELKEVYAGGDPINGYCYFDGLSFLNTYYGGDPSHDSSYYVGSYSSEYGVNGFEYDAYGNLLWMDGANASSFVASYFNTTELSAAGIVPFMQNTSGHTIMTTMNVTDANGRQVTHAVIITGFDSSTGTYTVHDPMSNQDEYIGPNKYSEINTSILIGVSGEK